jgi:hypothetical protein
MKELGRHLFLCLKQLRVNKTALFTWYMQMMSFFIAFVFFLTEFFGLIMRVYGEKKFSMASSSDIVKKIFMGPIRKFFVNLYGATPFVPQEICSTITFSPPTSPMYEICIIHNVGQFGMGNVIWGQISELLHKIDTFWTILVKIIMGDH